jgi:hypothetical protein
MTMPWQAGGAIRRLRARALAPSRGDGASKPVGAADLTVAFPARSSARPVRGGVPQRQGPGDLLRPVGAGHDARLATSRTRARSILSCRRRWDLPRPREAGRAR